MPTIVEARAAAAPRSIAAALRAANQRTRVDVRPVVHRAGEHDRHPRRGERRRRAPALGEKYSVSTPLPMRLDACRALRAQGARNSSASASVTKNARVARCRDRALEREQARAFAPVQPRQRPRARVGVLRPLRRVDVDEIDQHRRGASAPATYCAIADENTSSASMPCVRERSRRPSARAPRRGSSATVSASPRQNPRHAAQPREPRRELDRRADSAHSSRSRRDVLQVVGIVDERAEVHAVPRGEVLQQM